MLPTLGIYGIQDRQDHARPMETHDHGICLLTDGVVDWAIELERLTRRKHDNRLPRYLDDLLTPGDSRLPLDFRVAWVDSFVGRSLISAKGLWRFEANERWKLDHAPVRAMGHVHHRDIEAWRVPHELAHVGACLPFYGPFEDGALCVHIDGGASRSNVSVWLHNKRRFRRLHHSWKLSSAVTNFANNHLVQAMLGHRWVDHQACPGKLMALAACSRPDAEVGKWLVRHDWFRNIGENLDVPTSAAREAFGWNGNWVWQDPLVQTIAACVQAELCERVIRLLHHWKRRTNARVLYSSGGAALNISINDAIVKSGLFDVVRVPPCASDSGLALGAAALLEHVNGVDVRPQGPFLQRFGCDMTTADDPEIIQRMTECLMAGGIVAVAQGAGECGPRALGHRAILARPTMENKVRVSERIKRREPYRPVAPVVLRKEANRLFEGSPDRCPLARFMLRSFRAKASCFELAPGVVHVDGTARVQVVDERDRDLGLLRAVLEQLADVHGVPCLILTSFNGPGEPMVHTRSDAVSTAQRLGVDALVVDNEFLQWGNDASIGAVNVP